MKKLTVYTILISVILLFVSCASTASDVNSIKKGKREYTLSDHYIFDEQGQELFFDGYEKLGDYKDPNLWNDEQRQADYDENGRLTRGFLDGSRHYPKEWFCSYDEEGNLITDDDTDYYKQLLEDYKKSDLPVFEQQGPEEDDGTWEKYEYADDGSYTYTNNRGYQNSIVIQKYDSEGRLVYEKNKYGDDIWYDNAGRVIQWRDYQFIEYDEQGRIIYERYAGSVESEYWWEFDEQGRACRYKELHTHKTDPHSDNSREIEVTYDKEGFIQYVIEKELKHLNSDEIECICTERFYINKYTYFKNKQINECRQYRYMNTTEEWISR